MAINGYLMVLMAIYCAEQVKINEAKGDYFFDSPLVMFAGHNVFNSPVCNDNFDWVRWTLIILKKGEYTLDRVLKATLKM